MFRLSWVKRRVPRTLSSARNTDSGSGWQNCKQLASADVWNWEGSHSKVHYTHTHLMALFLGLPGSASTRKVKPVWILLKQETMSGSGISWAICKSTSHSRQITTPAPHHSSFLQAGCPFCRPTISFKALKAVQRCITVLVSYYHCCCHSRIL